MIVDSPESLAHLIANPSDVLIIGAGTAGLFLADQLERGGYRVLIAEAGGMVASTASAASQATLAGRPHKGTHEGRALGLGGASTLWGGQLALFDQFDFDRSFGPWPIGLDDLKPHYDAAEASLGVQRIRSADGYRKALGTEVEGAADEVERFFTLWLPEPNFARLFARQLRTSKTMHLLTNCPVHGFELEGARLSAARASWQGKPILLPARHIVIACSTIGSNRLLLSSGALQKMPWSGNSLLGKRFQDHLAYDVATVEVQNDRLYRGLYENAVIDGVRLQPKLGQNPKARSVAGRDKPAVSAALSARSSLAEHLANLKRVARSFRTASSLGSLAEMPAACLAVGRNILPFTWRYLSERRVMSFWDQGLVVQVQAEQVPLDRSMIRLDGTQLGPDGILPVIVDWRVDGQEIETIAAFTEAIGRRFEREGVARITIDPLVTSRNPDVISRASDTNHPAGGIQMGTSAATGLVDNDLRLFGTDNAFVLSAAVYPSSSQANCTFTLLALADRLACLLKKEKAG